MSDHEVPEFEKWLCAVCFQQPTQEAYDLAKCAWQEAFRRNYKNRTYFTWASMKQRCYNKDHQDYSRYGGRGIRVCERWRTSFENFYADMGEKPKGLSLDRINNDGDYEPTNCRWATNIEQARNKPETKWLTFRGRTLCLAEWAEELGIKRNTLQQRLLDGWSVERTLSEPLRRNQWR